MGSRVFRLAAVLPAAVLLAAVPAQALERIHVDGAGGPGDSSWRASATANVLYYNACTGWMWVYDGYTIRDRALTQFSVEPDEGTIPRVTRTVFHFYSSLPAGYGYTGLVSLHPVDVNGDPGPTLAQKPLLPEAGWQTVPWDSVRVPATFAVMLSATADEGFLFGILADHPAPAGGGPPACGLCFPDTRVSRSFYWPTQPPLEWTRPQGEYCGGAEFLFEAGGNFHAATGMPLGPFALEMRIEGGGSVSPDPADWIPAGQQVTIEAFPADGEFLHWVGTGPGSYSGTDNPAVITMNGPITQLARIHPYLELTLATDPPGGTLRVDGEPVATPYVVRRLAGTEVSVAADSLLAVGDGTRERFAGWSDGGGTASRTLILVGAPPLAPLVASFAREHRLDFHAAAAGTTTPAPGWFPEAAAVEIRAFPADLYTFAGWQGVGDGSYTGRANPAVVTMRGPITETPRFVPLGHGYEFRISADSANAFVNEASPADGPRQLWLWATCLERGLSAMQASLDTELPVLGFTPRNGVLNAGTATDLLLAIPGCPDAARLLGCWTVWDSGGELCMGPSGPDSLFATVDCAAPDPFLWADPRVYGFSSAGEAPCVTGSNGCEGTTALTVTSLRAVPRATSIEILWDVAIGASPAGFRLYRADVAGGGERVHPLGDEARSFTDDTVLPGRTYAYRLGVITAASEEIHGPIEVTAAERIPSGIRFVRPNPSAGSVEVGFATSREGAVLVTIHDVSGRRVQSLDAGPLPPGTHTVTWDGRDDRQRRAAAGVYFVTVREPDGDHVRKIVRVDE